MLRLYLDGYASIYFLFALGFHVVEVALYGVFHQACDCHWAYATWHFCDI